MMMGTTFPQGTTTPFKPIRKVLHIIKTFKPTVVPIVIDGLESFDKKGLR